MQLKKIRWRRWAVGVTGAAAVYTVAGYWLLPQLLARQLPRYVQSELERQATIGAVRFNPFTLHLEAEQIRLNEADGAPLFGIDKLEVELDWRSLPRRAWTFAEIRLVAPTVDMAIAPDGKFNIAAFLDTLNRKPHEESSGMPRLVIRHFALERGKVALRDRRAGYADTYAPIDFTLHQLSTLPDDNGDYSLSADAGHGGKLHWKGANTLNPMGGSGVLSLDKVALPGLSAYLKSLTRVTVTDGDLSATLPYTFSYRDGRFDAKLAGASLALHALALRRGGDAASFATLKQFNISEIGLDWRKRAVRVGAIRLDGGAVALRRDAQGEIDLANLGLPAEAPAPTAPTTPTPPAGKPSAPAAPAWSFAVKQIALDGVSFKATDDTVKPARQLSAEQMQLHLKLDGEQAAAGLQLTLADAAFSLADLRLASGTQTPFKLARLGFTGGALDLAGRRFGVERLYAEGGQVDLWRDGAGQVSMLKLPAKAAPAAATPPAREAEVKPKAKTPEAAGASWRWNAERVELSQFGSHFEDSGSGVKVNVQDFGVKLKGASSDFKKALDFDAAMALREGGQLTAHGKLAPAGGAVEADLSVKQLALAPLQPMLDKYVKLTIAGGNVAAQGHLSTGAGTAASPALRYAGSFEVAGLALDEADNDRFAKWKSVRADKLTLNLGPNLLDVAELRVVEPNATLIIENDRSFNAERLLVRPAAPDAAASVPTPVSASASAPIAGDGKAADTAFPVRVRRVRFQNAKLDFTDLSLRPQFSAKIYELNGVVTGLSSRRDARSQIELDGRVDQFGLARVRGQLNPFVPADNTDMKLLFKNVDMVSASPYSMKFAGYKIAEGKMSLDLQYKVRGGQLEGNNQIVLDKLTLGERIDSPDALKLPLELALAILKDSDGRIELGLPVSGDLKDPQFSYGAVVWKAVGNVLGKIVTSPFRALGNLFGISGDKLEAIEFDAGSDVLLPPEREKLVHVATILAKKGNLSLTVPGQFNAQSDGAALRAQAVRRAVLARAGVKLDEGERAGPLNLGERAVRTAMRELYAERFGKAELDKEKKTAEAAETAAPPATEAAPKSLPVLQRLGKLIQGEPQVADPAPFYRKLRERLDQGQPLPAGALPQLGALRAKAILAALTEEGIDAASARASAPEAVGAGDKKTVPVALGLSAK